MINSRAALCLQTKGVHPHFNPLNPLPPTPKISVITVSYNHAQFLDININSVLAQKYSDVEHIIIDGGSTDNTVEILKKYPHLVWSSERDKGQSDALNKGFAKAQGDIIVWLNSDDQLAPGCFKEIIPLLRMHPIALAGCQIVDEAGRPQQVVPNLERDWFDLIKYWVPQSSPAQPSVFFTRALLEASKFSPTEYVDPELFYCMDYDLWLRMARLVPFSFRSEKVLSVYPVYPSSKTGGDWSYIYREMSRVYRRHQNEIRRTERPCTVVVPVRSAADAGPLLTTLNSLLEQTLTDFEVLLPLADDLPGLPIRWVEKHVPSPIHSRLNIRVTTAKKESFFQNVIESIRSPEFVWAPPGEVLTPNRLAEVRQVFAEDRMAIILPSSPNDAAENGPIQPGEVFSTPFFLSSFAARRVAVLESLSLLRAQQEEHLVKELVLYLIHAGWCAYRDSRGRSSLSVSHEKSHSLNAYNESVNAQMVVTLSEVSKSDAFFMNRKNEGLSFDLPQELVTEAVAFLAAR
jgi:GT2 family glycosyltransferase